MTSIFNHVSFALESIQIPERFAPGFSPQQRKWAAITAIALAALTTFYLIYRCCLSANKRLPAPPRNPAQPNPVPAVPVPVVPPKAPPQKLESLDDMEQQIRKLQEDIQDQQDLLATGSDFIPPEESAESIDGVNPEEFKMITLCNDLDSKLTAYPTSFRLYLENQFQSYQKRDKGEIHEHISIFAGFMERYVDKPAFIRDGLQQIDQFLKKTFFTSPTECCLQEQQKVDLIVFNHFFTIVDKYFPVIEKSDPQLAMSLKIKLANLPLIDAIERLNFSNIHLTERDQLQIMVQHFQNLENKHLDELIKSLSTHRFTEKDIQRLSKMVSRNTSRLSDENILKLRQVLTIQMKNQVPADWDDDKWVYAKFTLMFPISIFQVQSGSAMTGLHRASVAKKYFKDQEVLPEDQIQIPRWYHTTKFKHLHSMIASGSLEVRHNRAYKGAWVSTQMETSEIGGDAALVFTHKIAQIDPNVFIGYEKGKVLWRGLQNAIPLQGHLALIAIQNHNFKSERAQIIQKLQQQGIVNPKVISNEQLNFIQKEIVRVIGNPNLSEKWWGKADIQRLDHPPVR